MCPRTYIERVCVVCNQPFMALPYKVRRGESKCCSLSCRNSYINSNYRLGENNPNWKGGVAKDNYRYKLRFVAKSPEKARVHRLVNRAVEAGKLERGPCAHCGAVVKTEAHHVDYTKPFEITWLCKVCHRKEHGRLRRKKIVEPRRPKINLPRRPSEPKPEPKVDAPKTLAPRECSQRERSSFHFGLFTCAYCLEEIAAKDRITRLVSTAIETDGNVLIPPGKQCFHKSCLKMIGEIQPSDICRAFLRATEVK